MPAASVETATKPRIRPATSAERTACIVCSCWLCVPSEISFIPSGRTEDGCGAQNDDGTQTLSLSATVEMPTLGRGRPSDNNRCRLCAASVRRRTVRENVCAGAGVRRPVYNLPAAGWTDKRNADGKMTRTNAADGDGKNNIPIYILFTARVRRGSNLTDANSAF